MLIIDSLCAALGIIFFILSAVLFFDKSVPNLNVTCSLWIGIGFLMVSSKNIIISSLSLICFACAYEYLKLVNQTA